MQTAIDSNATSVPQFLDQLVPLRNASHADIATYKIETPLRYSECVGLLPNGQRAELMNKRQFVGWSGNGACSALLFRSGNLCIEIDTSRLQDNKQAMALSVRDSSSKAARSFVTVDGSLLQD